MVFGQSLRCAQTVPGPGWTDSNMQTGNKQASKQARVCSYPTGAPAASGGAPGYPASGKMGIMHTVLGNVVADYLTGVATAKATLEKIEADYTTSAKEKGLL